MKINLIKSFFLVSSFFLMACEKDNSGHGRYIIGVSNSTSENYSISITLDGENKGSFIVKATQQGNYSSLCNDIVYAATLDNVNILNYVSSGKHKLILKNTSTNKVMITEEFEMKADACIAQQFNL